MAMAMARLDIDELLHGAPQAIAKTKIICTLGPVSRDVDTLEKLLHAGMNVARFNFSHGTHEYHQGTLDNLRAAMESTQIMCAVLLDTKGPEIRTGKLKGGKPIQLVAGKEMTISTDYELEGDQETITMSYKPLARDVAPGASILCADGTITLTVLSCDTENGWALEPARPPGQRHTAIKGILTSAVAVLGES